MALAVASPPETFPPYRPLVPVAVAFIAGILLREHTQLPSWGLWVVAGVAGATHLVLLRARATRAATVVLWVLVAAAGWLRLDLSPAHHPPPHRLARFVGTGAVLVKLRGRVASDPQVEALPPPPLSGGVPGGRGNVSRTRFDLRVSAAHCGGRWGSAWARVRVVVYAARPEIRYGDPVLVMGKIRRPSPASNPGALDGARLMRRRGIDLVMSAGLVRPWTEAAPGGFDALRPVYLARSRLRTVLRTALSDAPRPAGLLCALLLGDRTDLDDELEESFKRTGTMHVLAISGLHVGIVAWLVWHVAVVAGAGRRLSGLLVLASVVTYALMTGAPPSVVRAAVMTAAVVVAILAKRRPDLLQAAAAAALVLLVLRPLDLFNVGFQLSFAAVASIVCLCDDVRRVLIPAPAPVDRLLLAAEPSGARRLARRARSLVARALGLSVPAWLGVMPLGAYYFHIFSPITVLCNLVAVPLVAMLVLLGFAYMAVGSVWGAMGPVLAWPARALATSLTEVVAIADRVPLAWTYCQPPALGWVVGYYALGLVVVARKRLGLTGPRALMIWAAGVLVYLVAARAPAPPDALELTVLDVRHGSSAVLRYPNGATVVCDCGSYGQSDVGRWVATRALRSWGVQTIDLLAVSHADADHVNGIPSLLERFRVGRAVYSPVLVQSGTGRRLVALFDARGIPHQPVRGGDRIALGNGQVIDVLAPTAWTLRVRPDDQNENSLVLRAGHAGRRVLLPGDIQLAGTTVLMHAGADLTADVLVVPHHGCPLANSAAFARAVRPAYAICSNRADHLGAEAVRAYEAAGARVLATCWDGAVTVRLSEQGVEVVPFLRRAGATQAGLGK